MSLCRKLCVVCATLVLFAIGAVARADNWQIGRGIADITGPAVGIKMLGYVRPEQISAGIHLRQYSRAFVIARGERRVAIVTTDLQSVTHSLVLSVLDELKKKFDHAYQLDNVVIAATHTHAVPSGYWHYGADTPIGSPFNREHFEALVKGIAASIEAADRDLAPGRMFVARGDVENAGAQRSRTAYMQNPEMERSRYSADIDTAMTLLRFERDGRTIGFINWHAVHPTSMSYHNRLISSDNKGCAAYLCERARREQGDAGFVAAFAQSNCGDVTPNLTLDQRGPGSDEFASTRIIAERQCQAAEKLCENATEEISGSLDYRQSYVDFARLTVRDAITGCGDRQTCAAAYGYSFAAGSTEDGGGQPMFKEGMLQPDRLIEAIAKTFVPLPRPSAELAQAQLPKPILLAVGAANPPQFPHVLPVSVVRIGQLAMAVGPAEYTTMSGRRFRAAVENALPGVKYVVVAGYANDYAGYVATREEYEVQHYEGAATLFGPWTQAAYQQEFTRLAADIAADRPSDTHSPPVDMRGTVRPTPLGTKTDDAPPNAKFGDVIEDVHVKYAPGETVITSFWSGNPQNGYRTDRRYATIERQQQQSSVWRPVAADGDWEVKIRWDQPKEAGKQRTAAHALTVEWNPPPDIRTGTFRIRHNGVYKSIDGAIHEFVGYSRPFKIK